MLRRSSGSTPADEHDDQTGNGSTIACPDTAVEGKGRAASCDSGRESIRTPKTLDRRKRDSLLTAPQRQQPGWQPPPLTANGSSQRKQKATVSTEQSNDIVNMLEPPMPRRSRVRSPWRCSILILTTTTLSLIALLCILHAFVTRQLDPKGCRMSMMRPAFAKFSDFDSEHTRFASKYSLYLYREGGIDEDTMVSRPGVVGRETILIRSSCIGQGCSGLVHTRQCRKLQASPSVGRRGRSVLSRYGTA